jgi:hypothetical protein
MAYPITTDETPKNSAAGCVPAALKQRPWLASTTELSIWSGISLSQIQYFIKAKGLPKIEEVLPSGKKVYKVDAAEFLLFWKSSGAGKHQLMPLPIEISSIVADPKTQWRPKIDREQVGKIAQSISEGKAIDALDVMSMPTSGPILLHGWHRYSAGMDQEVTTMNAYVLPHSAGLLGWLSLRANSRNGLPMQREVDFVCAVFASYPGYGDAVKAGAISQRKVQADLGLRNHVSVHRALIRMQDDTQKIPMETEPVLIPKPSLEDVESVIDAWKTNTKAEEKKLNSEALSALNRIRHVVTSFLASELRVKPRSIDRELHCQMKVEGQNAVDAMTRNMLKSYTRMPDDQKRYDT